MNYKEKMAALTFGIGFYLGGCALLLIKLMEPFSSGEVLVFYMFMVYIIVLVHQLIRDFDNFVLKKDN